MTPRSNRLANLRAIHAWERRRLGKPGRPAPAIKGSEAISSKLPSDGPGKATPIYLGQLIRGYQTQRDAHVRTPSEALARALEDAYGLPEGWMSQAHADPMADLDTRLLGRSPRPGPVSDTLEIPAIPTHDAGSGTVQKNSEPARDIVTIREYETGGSMGRGVVLKDQPGLITSWTVTREWVQKNLRAHSSADNLCVVTGFGDSMRPLFHPGDPLLIDAGVKSVEFDGIYFFRVGDEGFIKRLQRIPTEEGTIIRAKSDNKQYDDFEITSKLDFEVFGRVLRIWKGEDF